VLDYNDVKHVSATSVLSMLFTRTRGVRSVSRGRLEINSARSGSNRVVWIAVANIPPCQVQADSGSVYSTSIFSRIIQSQIFRAISYQAPYDIHTGIRGPDYVYQLSEVLSLHTELWGTIP
jgi:hypothetical protein